MERIRAEGVAKRFGARSVLQGLDLDLRQGETLSVVGPNGTGKSTLLRLLAGTYLPDEGRVTLAGIPASKSAARALVATSYNDDRSWYGRLSVWENLRFWQSLRGPWPGRMAELLHDLGLDKARDVPVAVLSSGQRARLGVVRALCVEAPILILDEPTRGVDAAAGVVVADAIVGATRTGTTAVVATHDDLLRERIGGGVLTLGYEDLS
ncbi:MAG: heme ABC exporter ATP-binding protein CcmA [Actinomycetota bacterium]|nr:heme ABC exporter ATP-binding protein CcmA [Actinomycetota bacterium]